MNLPWWYKAIILLWGAAVAPLWLFVALVSGEFFFPITFANPSEGSGWQLSLAFQLIMILAFLSPALFLPLVIFQTLRANRNTNAQDR